MKKYLGILLVALMAFAIALPALAGADDPIYLGGGGTGFTEEWINEFKVADDVGKDPNVWHLIYSGNDVNQITEMQLDFGDNGIWYWTPSMGFSTNKGGNNHGWVVKAPYDWELLYVDIGNNDNKSNSYLKTKETGNYTINFKVSGYHKGKGPDDPKDPRGVLYIKKHVDGTFIGNWFATLSEDEAAEIAEQITFEVYAVDNDEDDNFANLVGEGFLEPDGTITFKSNEDGSNKFAPGWYAIFELLEGRAAEIFVHEDGKVGPYYFEVVDGKVVDNEGTDFDPNLHYWISDLWVSHGRDVTVNTWFKDGTFWGDEKLLDGTSPANVIYKFEVRTSFCTVCLAKPTDKSCDECNFKSYPAFCANYGSTSLGGTGTSYIPDNLDPAVKAKIISAFNYIYDKWGSLDGWVEDTWVHYVSELNEEGSTRVLAQIAVWMLIDDSIESMVAKNGSGSGLWYTFINNYVAGIIKAAEEGYTGSGAVCDIFYLKSSNPALNEIVVQPQIVPIFGGFVFNNSTEKKYDVLFKKIKVGGIFDGPAKKGEFSFDLFKLDKEAGEVLLKTYEVGRHGVVKAYDLTPGKYLFREQKHDVWKLEDAGSLSFTITGSEEVGKVIKLFENKPVKNVPILGPSCNSVSATNEGNQVKILTGLNPKNGNPYYGDKKAPDTPFVVPNSNHFVYAELKRADLEKAKGVVLDMMVGNKFDVVGKALVKLVDGKLEITLNGEGKFGAIAFNQIPVFNNGNIHSQKEADLKKSGALAGFNHDNKRVILCPAGNVIYLYIHCDPIEFYNDIIAW